MSDLFSQLQDHTKLSCEKSCKNSATDLSAETLYYFVGVPGTISVFRKCLIVRLIVLAALMTIINTVVVKISNYCKNNASISRVFLLWLCSGCYETTLLDLLMTTVIINKANL